MIAITPVIEVPWSEEGYKWPWLITSKAPFSFLELHSVSNIHLGTFFAALCSSGSPDSIDSCMKQIREASELIVSGGFGISSAGINIFPSCCCGLENWMEWKEFLDNGNSPWMGHDPSGWAERKGDQIIIWADGGGVNPFKPTAPCISVSVKDFEHALTKAEKQLQIFFSAFPSWLKSVGCSDTTDIIEKIHHEFKIRPIEMIA